MHPLFCSHFWPYSSFRFLPSASGLQCPDLQQQSYCILSLISEPSSLRAWLFRQHMWWLFVSYILHCSGPRARMGIFLYPVIAPGFSSLTKLSSIIDYYPSHHIILPHFSRISVLVRCHFTSAVLVIIYGDLSIHNDNNILAPFFLRHLSSNYLSCVLTTRSRTCHNQYFKPFHNLSF